MATAPHPNPLDLSTLFGREARCACGTVAPSSDHQRLAFFQFRGPGSRAATEHCLHCRYFEVAHEAKRCDGCDGTGSTRWHKVCPRCKGRGELGPAARMRDPEGTSALVACPGFEPHGAFEYDTWYCGHAGFD